MNRLVSSDDVHEGFLRRSGGENGAHPPSFRRKLVFVFFRLHDLKSPLKVSDRVDSDVCLPNI